MSERIIKEKMFLVANSIVHNRPPSERMLLLTFSKDVWIITFFQPGLLRSKIIWCATCISINTAFKSKVVSDAFLQTYGYWLFALLFNYLNKTMYHPKWTTISKWRWNSSRLLIICKAGQAGLIPHSMIDPTKVTPLSEVMPFHTGLCLFMSFDLFID